MAEYEFLGAPGDEPPPPPLVTAQEPACPPPAPADPGPAPTNPEGEKDAKTRNDGSQTDLCSKPTLKPDTNNSMTGTTKDFGMGQTTCGRPTSVMAKQPNQVMKRRRSKPFLVTMGIFFCFFLTGAIASAILLGVSIGFHLWY
ncbi:hypothetical protein AAVH_11669 [Aphelenchoides avenae]|nr:hypothetical protein AAVH_11669 [Aphelenchus avenae]